MSRWMRYACLAGFVLVAPACRLCPEPSCTYVLSRTSVSMPPGGGSETISVTASRSSCSWSAVSNSDWLTVTSGAKSTGTSAVTFTAPANGGLARTGALRVAEQAVAVAQGVLPTYALSGRVTDVFMGTGPRGDLGIPGVTVAVTGPGSGSATTESSGSSNTRGNYRISALPPGSYNVSASKAEYATATGTVLISGDTTLPLAVSLIAPSPPTPADLTGYWSGTGDYFHAPFKLALVQSGNTLRGDYLDSHDDTWDVSGIYAPTGFTLRVNFGDTAIMLECNSFENAREIRGVQRVQGRAYNFTMTR